MQSRDEEHGGLLGKEMLAITDLRSGVSQKWVKRLVGLVCVALAFYAVAGTSVVHKASAKLSPLLSPASSNAATSSASGWAHFETIFALYVLVESQNYRKVLMSCLSGDSYTSYASDEREGEPPFKCKIMTEGERFRQKPNWMSV